MKDGEANNCRRLGSNAASQAWPHALATAAHVHRSGLALEKLLIRAFPESQAQECFKVRAMRAEQ